MRHQSRRRRCTTRIGRVQHGPLHKPEARGAAHADGRAAHDRVHTRHRYIPQLTKSDDEEFYFLPHSTYLFSAAVIFSAAVPFSVIRYVLFSAAQFSATWYVPFSAARFSATQDIPFSGCSDCCCCCDPGVIAPDCSWLDGDSWPAELCILRSRRLTFNSIVK